MSSWRNTAGYLQHWCLTPIQSVWFRRTHSVITNSLFATYFPIHNVSLLLTHSLHMKKYLMTFARSNPMTFVSKFNFGNRPFNTTASSSDYTSITLFDFRKWAWGLSILEWLDYTSTNTNIARAVPQMQHKAILNGAKLIETSYVLEWRVYKLYFKFVKVKWSWMASIYALLFILRCFVGRIIIISETMNYH